MSTVELQVPGPRPRPRPRPPQSPPWRLRDRIGLAFAWFLGLFSLFAKFFPVFSMTELKEGITWLRQAVKKGFAQA